MLSSDKSSLKLLWILSLIISDCCINSVLTKSVVVPEALTYHHQQYDDGDLQTSAAEPRPVIIDVPKHPVIQSLPLIYEAGTPITDASEKVEKILHRPLAFSYNNNNHQKLDQSPDDTIVEYFGQVRYEDDADRANRGVAGEAGHHQNAANHPAPINQKYKRRRVGGYQNHNSGELVAAAPQRKRIHVEEDEDDEEKNQELADEPQEAIVNEKYQNPREDQLQPLRYDHTIPVHEDNVEQDEEEQVDDGHHQHANYKQQDVLLAHEHHPKLVEEHHKDVVGNTHAASKIQENKEEVLHAAADGSHGHHGHGHKHHEHKHHDHDKKHEKGGGKEHHADHHGEHGEKGEKGYEGDHKYEKKESGHHDKKGHKGKYKDHGEHKKKHHHEDGHYGEHNEGEEGKKGSEYDEEGEHSKGHSTKGEHNVHKKDEYEKKHEFFDEHHEGGDHEKHGGFDDEHEYEKGGHEKAHHKHGGHHDEHYGKDHHHEKGHHHHSDKGHKDAEGKHKHHDHHDEHHEKEKHDKGKKHHYKKSSGDKGHDHHHKHHEHHKDGHAAGSISHSQKVLQNQIHAPHQIKVQIKPNHHHEGIDIEQHGNLKAGRYNNVPSTANKHKQGLGGGAAKVRDFSRSDSVLKGDDEIVGNYEGVYIPKESSKLRRVNNKNVNSQRFGGSAGGGGLGSHRTSISPYDGHSAKIRMDTADTSRPNRLIRKPIANGGEKIVAADSIRLGQRSSNIPSQIDDVDRKIRLASGAAYSGADSNYDSYRNKYSDISSPIALRGLDYAVYEKGNVGAGGGNYHPKKGTGTQFPGYPPNGCLGGESDDITSAADGEKSQQFIIDLGGKEETEEV